MTRFHLLLMASFLFIINLAVSAVQDHTLTQNTTIIRRALVADSIVVYLR